MGRKPKNIEKDDTQVDEQTEETIVVEDQPEIFNEVALDNNEKSGEELEEKVEEEPTQIASKQFVRILKEELKKENISESIYTAFLASVPKVDWEKNYRLIWETTFKRPPIEKPVKKQTPVQEK
jgi:hypothetical protein